MKKNEIMGDRIRELREKKDMTQTELAKAAGFESKSAIAKLESGANGTSYAKLGKIADTLETSTDYLLGHTNINDRAHYYASMLENKAYDALHEPALKQAYGNAGKVVDSIYEAGNERPEVLETIKLLADCSYDLSPRDLEDIQNYIKEKAKRPNDK